MIRWSIATPAWRRPGDQAGGGGEGGVSRGRTVRERSDFLLRLGARRAADRRRLAGIRRPAAAARFRGRAGRRASAQFRPRQPQARTDPRTRRRLLCLCSTVAEDALDIPRGRRRTRRTRRPRPAVRRAHRLRGARLGPYVNDWTAAWDIVAQGRPAKSRHRARQFPHLRARQPPIAPIADCRANRSRWCRSPTRRRS